MQDVASEEHGKLVALQQENQQLRCRQDKFDAFAKDRERLQKLEQEVEQYRNMNVNPRDLETFITHKTAIRHYLKLVPMLLE